MRARGLLALACAALLAAILGATALRAAALPASCPNEAIRVEQHPTEALPDCRAYELVSPPYKEAFPVFAQGLSADGSQLLLESFGSFSSPEDQSSVGISYRVTRTETGWQPSPLDVPFSTLPVYNVQGMSTDFQSSLWTASKPGQPPLARDLYLDPPAGPPTLIGPGAPPGVVQSGLNYVGASDDLRHLLLSDRSPQATEEDRLWPGDTTIAGNKPSLYEYEGTANAEPRLLGVSDEGIPASIPASHLISNCGTSLGSAEKEDAYNAVSADGETVFFTAEACGGSPPVNELYARIGAQRTVAISEPSASIPGRQCTGACATAEPQPGTFAGASRDGTEVYFATSQPLLNSDTDNGPDLYQAEIPPGALTRIEHGQSAITRLTQVSRGGLGDPTPGSGADLLGVARLSEDGSHVYFVAAGALTGANREGVSPVVGEPNLYVSVSECPGGGAGCAEPAEHTSFIATLSREDSHQREGDWSPEDARPVQATPDGRFLVFQSVADLTPDQHGLPEAGQVFEYDSQAETLVRVSRGADGYNQDGNSASYAATIPLQVRESGVPGRSFWHFALSADGARVVFSSADALTPRALAGANNVYEYHTGQVSLISDGHDALRVQEHPATELIGTDESGRDVFFETADPLVPQDTDTQVDVYDARENGGFPTPTPPPTCSGEACQAALSQPSAPTPPISAALTGSGNPGPRPKRHHTRRHHHTRRGGGRTAHKDHGALR